MSRHVDEPDRGPFVEPQIGEADIDGDAASIPVNALTSAVLP